MNNAELIKALRCCASTTNIVDECERKYCGYNCELPTCIDKMMLDAADALEAADKRIAELEAQIPKEGEWIMDEHPHDGDCRCSVCLVAIDAMHERNHGLLNALTGGKWWTFYRYCPNCGARIKDHVADVGNMVKKVEKNDETELKGEITMEKNCKDCSKSHAVEDGVFECEAYKYDINTKSCFVPKICKVEKNQRLINHIMEFDVQGKEYDWYEQHIALIDGERKDGERDGES